MIRHPLDRAHRAFWDIEQGGMSPEQRNILSRVHGVHLPKSGQPFTDLSERRAAFLAFLRFLKRNLAGQTGFRTESAWASQTAILQGFVQAQTPDLILREDRLQTGLAFLAVELGLPAPVIPLPRDACDDALQSIRDGELEEAARDTYQKDYLSFGFFAKR